MADAFSATVGIEGLNSQSVMRGEIPEHDEREFSPLGEVLRNMAQHDKTIRSVISMGTWSILYYKPSYIVMVNQILHRTLVLWKQRVKKGYKHVQIMWRYTLFNELWSMDDAKNYYKKIMAKDVCYSNGKINVKKTMKRLSDEDRLRINRQKQLELKQKIQELQDRYNAIKYRRKEPYKTEKQKIRQLIEGYKQLLKQLQDAQKELEKKLGIRQNAKVLKI